MKLLKSYFADAQIVEKEFSDYPLQVTEGAIPSQLSGTLFRNGNGRFQHYGIKYNHLFDGDGMVCAFRFGNGAVSYSNKYVETREWKQEKASGKFMFRGFGTNKPGGLRTNFLDMNFKNVANTSLVHHNGKLLALWEGGLPHEIDPDTLETLGRFDYEGTLINTFSTLDKRIAPELPFSAHPKIARDGTLHNFGTASGIKNRLVHYEVSTEGSARIAHVTPLQQLHFTHDFVLTAEGDKIFFLTPVKFDLLRSFMGLATPADSMRAIKNERVKILVLDKNYQSRVFETDFAFLFHFINGYRSGEQLIVDGLMLSDWPSSESMQAFLNGEVEELTPFTPTRYMLNLKSGEVRKEKIAHYGMEFPMHHPHVQGSNYRYAWGIAAPLINDEASPLLDGLLKLDLKHPADTHFLSLQGCLPGEPMFIPTGDAEDEGLLILPVYNGATRQTELRGYQAVDLSHTFTAVLPHRIPLGFHGTWVGSE